MAHYRILEIGTDTELFLKDRKTKKPVPVVGLLGGTKDNPRSISEELRQPKGFCVQEDNVMVEFNLPSAPLDSQFIYNTTIMLKYLDSFFAERNLYLDISPSQEFELDQLRHPQARRFGCEPDYCAWNLEENEVDTTNSDIAKLRTAGGHLHISFLVNDRPPEIEHSVALVKALDIFVGIPMLFYDLDTRRRLLYGKAGAFRLKEYGPDVRGVEYRVLSNYWINYPKLISFVFGGVNHAAHFLNHEINTDSYFDNWQENITSALNSSNLEIAKAIVSEHGIALRDRSNPFIDKNGRFNPHPNGEEQTKKLKKATKEVFPNLDEYLTTFYASHNIIMPPQGVDLNVHPEGVLQNLEAAEAIEQPPFQDWGAPDDPDDGINPDEPLEEAN